MVCWHNWSKWGEEEGWSKNILNHGVVVGTGSVLIQKRKCIKCNMMEIREVVKEVLR